MNSPVVLEPGVAIQWAAPYVGGIIAPAFTRSGKHQRECGISRFLFGGVLRVMPAHAIYYLL